MRTRRETGNHWDETQQVGVVRALAPRSLASNIAGIRQGSALPLPTSTRWPTMILQSNEGIMVVPNAFLQESMQIENRSTNRSTKLFKQAEEIAPSAFSAHNNHQTCVCSRTHVQTQNISKE